MDSKTSEAIALKILKMIAYPARGTTEERATLFEFALLIQRYYYLDDKSTLKLRDVVDLKALSI